MGVSRTAAGDLLLGGMLLSDVVSQASVDTPFYAYDLDAMDREARDLVASFGEVPHLVAYAVKANTAGPVLRRFATAGLGADVVSGSELSVAMRAGVLPEKIVFSGVAKRDDEIALAFGAGERGILAIQLESLEEIPRAAAVARRMGRKGRVALRINPSVDKESLATHSHISTGHDEAKFGISLDDVTDALAAVKSHNALELVGVNMHIGSQLTDTSAYVDAARKLYRIAKDIRDNGCTSLAYVDTGGGFGIDYGEGCAVTPADFVRGVRKAQAEFGLSDLMWVVEPGRALVAAHGVIVSRVIAPKRSGRCQWLLIDAGMNDLIRPALYQARHRIVPLALKLNDTSVDFRVVGPVCESSDDFGIHAMPERPPTHVAILDAGAYGFTMASQYNGRALPAEVFIEGGKVTHFLPGISASEWVERRLLG